MRVRGRRLQSQGWSCFILLIIEYLRFDHRGLSKLEVTHQNFGNFCMGEWYLMNKWRRDPA